MTQEEKELLLKDLCSRLPYGVICYDEAQNETGIFKQFEYEGFGRIHIGRGMRYIEHIHPILRPMSSMTDEERKEYELLANHCIVTSIGFIHLEAAPLTDWLNANHFDYRGLIPKGLAIEAPEGMYC